MKAITAAIAAGVLVRPTAGLGDRFSTQRGDNARDRVSIIAKQQALLISTHKQSQAKRGARDSLL